MTIPNYTSQLPTVVGWYFWKQQEAYTGDPIFVFHDSPYGADKTQPLRTNTPERETPADLGGLWSGPIFDPDEDMGDLVRIAPAGVFEQLRQAASEMVAVTHFSGCIDGATADARDNLEQVLKSAKPQNP